MRQRQTNLMKSVFDSVSRFATVFDAERQCLIFAMISDSTYCIFFVSRILKDAAHSFYLVFAHSFYLAFISVFHR